MVCCSADVLLAGAVVVVVLGPTAFLNSDFWTSVGIVGFLGGRRRLRRLLLSRRLC